MYVISLIRCALVVSLLLAAVSPTRANPVPPSKSDFVELVKGSIHEASLNGRQTAVWIAVQPKVAAKDLSVLARPLDVSVGSRHELPWVQAFEAVWHGEPPSADSEAKTPAPLAFGIELRIDTSALPGPDTYEVLLAVQHKGSPEQQTLRLQIGIPAATLRAKTGLLIEQTLPWWGGTARAGTPLLVVTETGRKSYAQLHGAVSVVTDSPQMSAVHGEVLLVDKPVVPRGEMQTLRFKTSGEFPLGTVKGMLDLQSPQLSTSAVVPFEVRTRRDHVLIILLILLGLVAGLLTRTVLSSRIALGEQLVKLDALRESLTADAGQQADRATAKKLQALVRSLDEAQKSTNPQQISDRLRDAETERREIMQALSSARATLETRLQAHQKLLAEPLDALPPTVCSVLEKAPSELPDIQHLLEKGDVTEAVSRLDEAERRMRHALWAVLRTWHDALAMELQRLPDPPIPLLAREQTILQSSVSPLVQQAGQLIASIDQQSPDTAPLLGLARQLHAAVLRTTPWLTEALNQALISTRDVLRSLGLSEDPSLQALSPIRHELFEGDGLKLLQKLRAQARSLGQAQAQTLQRILPLPFISDDRRRELSELKKQEAYLDALSQAMAFQQEDAARRSAEDSVLRGPLRMAAAVAKTPLGAPPAGVSTSVLVPTPTQVPVGGVASPSIPAVSPQQELTRTGSRLRLNLQKILQGTLSGLGIAVVGYLLFQAQFVGTPQELITIFFWGFSADISVESLLTFSKGLRLPETRSHAVPAAPPPAPGTPR